MNPAFRGLVAALLVGAALSWTGSTAPAASATEPGTRPAEIERAIFTGTFIGSPQVQTTGGARVRIYRVAVVEVFGPVDVPTQRVLVRAAVALENCPATGGGQQGEQGEQEQPEPTGQPEPGSAGQEQAGPTQPDATPDPPATSEPGTTDPSRPPPASDRQLRLFDTVEQDGSYVASSCAAVAIASETVLGMIEQQFGAGRGPGTPVEPDPFEEVGYLCPDTRDAVTDLDDSASCAALDDDRSFDRMAAPGLALVIVGMLGLFVARRMGRSRR